MSVNILYEPSPCRFQITTKSQMLALSLPSSRRLVKVDFPISQIVSAVPPTSMISNFQCVGFLCLASTDQSPHGRKSLSLCSVDKKGTRWWRSQRRPARPPEDHLA